MTLTYPVLYLMTLTLSGWILSYFSLRTLGTTKSADPAMWPRIATVCAARTHPRPVASASYAGTKESPRLDGLEDGSFFPRPSALSNYSRRPAAGCPPVAGFAPRKAIVLTSVESVPPSP